MRARAPEQRYLDLHGLFVDEAVRATTERLDALALAGGGGELELVPGAGHHSAGGKAATAFRERRLRRSILFECGRARH